MAFAHLQQNFQKLSGSLKLVGIGGLLLAVSTLLPWYADLDQFRVGDMFLGITGPAWIVGVVILLLSLGSFGIFLAHLLEKRAPKLPFKESVFHLLVGIESLFLLFIVNSIYFHPKFGVNITLKESRFGMMLGLIASIVLIVGGYYEMKKEKKTEDYIGKLEPLIRVKPEPATHPRTAPPQPSVKPVVQPYERKHQVFAARQGMVERAQEELSDERKMPSPYDRQKQLEKIVAQPELVKPFESKSPETPKPESKPEFKDEGGSYMIRMDL